MRRSLEAFLLALLALGLVALLSCSDSGDADPVAGGGQGQLTVNLHDQAAPDITQAVVTISALEVRDADTGEWVAVELQDTTFDLVVLVNGNEATLANAPLDEGDYDGMRLTVESVHVELDGADPVDIAGPFAVQVSGFPLVAVSDGESVTVTLDFPVDTSFQVSGGNVGFSPQITFESAS